MLRSLSCLRWIVLLGTLVATIPLPSFAQQRSLQILPEEGPPSPAIEGKNWAVLIGIDRYQQWPPLRNAVSEAKSLKRVLETKYRFDGFFEFYDGEATVVNLRRFLTQTLPTKLGPQDSLLLFYAGHGHLDTSQSGFWIPVDGGQDPLAQVSWLPNAQLKNYLGQLKVKRLLVMADSCFSGDLLTSTRGAGEEIDAAYFQRALKYNARQVLTAGGLEAVPDNSEFGRQLIRTLEENTDELLDTLSVYDRLRRGVVSTLPLFGTLPGNEQGGSFVFFRRLTDGTAPVAIHPLPAPPLGASRSALLPLLTARQQDYKTQQLWGWGTLTLGVLGTGLGVYGLWDGKQSYASYQVATNADLIVRLKNQMQLDTNLVYLGVGSAVVGLVATALLWFLDPSAPVQSEMEKLP